MAEQKPKKEYSRPEITKHETIRNVVLITVALGPDLERPQQHQRDMDL